MFTNNALDFTEFESTFHFSWIGSQWLWKGRMHCNHTNHNCRTKELA